MILPFSQQIDKKPTYFAEKILANKMWTIEELDKFYFEGNTTTKLWGHYGLNMQIALNCLPKLHTIREDKNDRWFAGRLIHPYYNNRTKRAFQFAPKFQCTGYQYIKITWGTYYDWKQDKRIPVQRILVGDWLSSHYLDEKQKEQLALNDGFDSYNDFCKYFNKDFKGKIIHWTDLMY